MGQHVECTECSFRFDGGHSHHTGSSWAMCVSCLSHYVLPTVNPWGPDFGERIWLLLARTARDRPGKYIEHRPPLDTGIFITARASEQRGVFDLPFVVYPIEKVACPQCLQVTVVLGFDDSDACPECGEKSLEISFIEY